MAKEKSKENGAVINQEIKKQLCALTVKTGFHLALKTRKTLSIDKKMFQTH
ncbi:hypothetical protein PP175_16310 [Aneurinibacillus sp. Ricciae_BoGa-3]|uniref:hypothetical protein n=1 Tax=Aneurinibacillus sp. Ricciae_BoGa-3 TaxID=3022697 RepID=UPI0023402BDA|nr:hypothetical protein [Aneurinibacillus sp. Ricciae_BoGa-3]WCK52976.1 hypothetical protein PP175_16310 [Aneurinibacillus sp. Ricciae_BoGa-3]